MTSNESPQKEVTIVLATLKDIAEAVIHAAEATETQVETTQDAAQFQTVIRDNGRGLNPTRDSEHDGLGLHNMMQRARIYGGKVMVDGATGVGTHLTLRLPL